MPRPAAPRRGPPRDATGNGNASAFPAFSFRRVAVGPGFVASPSALAPGVRAETLPGGAREFYLEVRLGRATLLLADAGSCGPSSERCEV